MYAALEADSHRLPGPAVIVTSSWTLTARVSPEVAAPLESAAPLGGLEWRRTCSIVADFQSPSVVSPKSLGGQVRDNVVCELPAWDCWTGTVNG